MNSIIFKFLLFICIHQCVLGQVCEETRSVLQEVPETFRFSFVETYEEPCFLFCSVKTRKSVNVTTRTVQRYENVTISVCCDGYAEDFDHEGNGIYCEPICDPPCENGYCRKPNQCACEPGYALDNLNPNVCKPLCLEGCLIPNCITTTSPQCSSNTSLEAIPLTLDSNRPYCPEPCTNGVCIEPGICQCLPGYYATSPNICEADLQSNFSCKNGTFIKPNICLCDFGWEMKCGAYEPVCNGCDHGTCISPDECKCDEGYINNEGKCEPQCSNGCANGKCVSPDVCSCDPGWYKSTEDGECQPHCDMNCNHGDCIAPNICDCHSGYQLYINSKGRSRCLVNRKNCTDSSSKPETCECRAPYQVSYFRDDGNNCLCVGACADESTRCTKATCLFMNVPPEPEQPELDYDYLIDSDEEDYEEDSETTTENEDDDDITTTTEELTTESFDILTSHRTEDNTDHLYDEESYKTQITTPSNKHDKVNGQQDKPKTVPNIENIRRKREAITMPVHWIIGSVIVSAIVVLLVLGFVAKRKCFTAKPLRGKGKLNKVYI